LKRKLNEYNKEIKTNFKHVEILFAFSDENYHHYFFRFYQFIDKQLFLVFSDTVFVHKLYSDGILRQGNLKLYYSKVGHLVADCSFMPGFTDESFDGEIIKQYNNNRRQSFIEKWKALKPNTKS
jgi:hypothetical protein